MPHTALASVSPLPVASSTAFANREVFLPSWFALARSRELRPGRLLSAQVGPRRLVLWRDATGTARAFDASCPHLGADLGRGCIVDGQLRCALHHWRFDTDGACTSSPGTHPPSGRRATSYPTVERHGLVFTYPSLRPAIPFPELPDGDDARNFHPLVLPAARLRAHHHLTTANGLDGLHFDSLHDVEPLAPARLEVDPAAWAVHLHLRGRHRSRLLRALTGGEMHGRFSAIGPSIAWVTLMHPLRWHALFVTRPLPDGGSESRSVLFVPRGAVLQTVRPILFLLSLLRQDGQMLDALEHFRPTFTAADAPLAAFGALLERWPRG
jgi:nitrite reductase/ring-hydroxylating ferredoxin subunit